MRSSSSYAQLNPVLREEEMEGVPQFRFKLQEDPAEGAHHSYSEVALVPLAHSFGAKGQLSSRSGLPLQEAMKVAPAMSKEEEDNAAHPYFNLSKVRGWVRGGGGGGAPPSLTIVPIQCACAAPHLYVNPLLLFRVCPCLPYSA